MRIASIALLVIGSLLNGSLLLAQSTSWDVKKQRKLTGQRPSFQYQTRNGSQNPSARTHGRSASLPLGLQVRGRSGQEPPREIRGTLPTVAGSQARTNKDLPSAAAAYLEAVAPVMQIATPADEFVPSHRWKDPRGKEHLRMQQRYQDIEVYGSEIVVHADDGHAVQGLNGRYMSTPQRLTTSPTVTEQQAIAQATSHLAGQEALTPEQQHLLDYEGPKAKLVILPAWETGEPRLAWQVLVRPTFLDYWELLIDAQRGELIRRTNLTCSFAPALHGSAKEHPHAHAHRPAAPARSTSASQGSGQDLNGENLSVDTWQSDGTFWLIDASKDMFASDVNTQLQDLEGVLITYDALRQPNPESVSIVNSTTNSFADPSAVSAHYNASVAYDFFRQQHQRSAIDGRGGNILSVVNFVDEDGEEMDNAFWNGKFMVYGNGNIGFTPLAGGLDVGGHEMTHGVINATANLVYRNESGAINEHIADVFGVLIDEEDYLLGEDIVRREVYRTGAMRDMEDPHNGGTSLRDNGWQPDHISEIYTGEQDNGGVHINSGIPNRAFFLFASEIGKEKAGQVYYHALTTYLTASSEFTDLRRAVINSATDLFGAAEAQAAASAFDAVGITDTVGDEVPDEEEEEELPTIGGSDFLLTVNTDPADGNSLYLINNTSQEFEAISTTSIRRKPTVTDDGSLAFFVTEDETIRGIELISPYNEEVLNDESFWSNISISKDGNRLAIISNEQIPEIWVIDLERETDNVVRFELYNPTTQEGVTTGEVQYADAIEWDYSGEYLVYDAYNSVAGFGLEESIDYWDVGYIQVWDNTANDFGDGQITKIFTNLPPGVNIGNPSFSKTNRNIVCFDLFNAEEETYQIIATDLSTGETQTVYENNTLGFPSYSSDDRFMVFDIIDEEGRPAMGQIALNADKLTSTGELSVPYVEAQWTSWFAQGTRVINSSQKELLSYELLIGNSAVAATIDGTTISASVPDTVDVTRLVARFEQSPSAEVYVGEFRQISEVTRNDFRQEITYTVIAQDGSTQTYEVQVTQEEVDDPVTSVEDDVSVGLLAYPNPFEQTLNLTRPAPGADVSLVDVIGRSYSLDVQGPEIVVQEPLASGVYLLRIRTNDAVRTFRLLRR